MLRACATCGVVQRGCGGLSLPEIHILDPKGPTVPESSKDVTFVARKGYQRAAVDGRSLIVPLGTCYGRALLIGVTQWGCGGLSLPEIHILDPKGLSTLRK